MTRSEDGHFLRSISEPEREREPGPRDQMPIINGTFDKMRAREATVKIMFFMYSRRQAMYGFSGG
jgi:hypothetical protein